MGTQYEKGLADSESPEIFKAALARAEKRWNNLESKEIPQFFSWFLQYKADVIIKCVLPEVRDKAGWKSGRVGGKFTTNSSESLNHVIKQEVEWKESKLPVLVEHLKAIVDQHDSELEKAVVGRGEWKFSASYKHLEVDDKIWFPEMNVEQRQKHMKVKCYELGVSSNITSKPGSFELSVPANALHSYGTTSLHTLMEEG